MNIRIRASKSGELHLTPILHPTLKSLQIPGSICYCTSGPFGHILVQRLDAEDITLLYHTIYLEEDQRLIYSSDEQAIRLQIVQRNSYYYESRYLGSGVIHERGLQVNYLPGIHTTLHIHGQETYNHLSIYYRQEHLADLHGSFPRLEELLQAIQHKQAFVYNTGYCVADTKMLTLVDYMLDNPFKGHLQSSYLSMLCKDLLLEALLKIDESRSTNTIVIGEKEVRHIYQAKEILLRDMHKPFSLDNVAAEAGISSFKLNREFKAIYGMGLKEYLLEARMKKAMQVLAETDTPVSTVARDSGYASAQSFSLAFKNYFGCTPGSIHRRGKAAGGHFGYPTMQDK